MREAYIAGVFVTPFGKYLDRNLRSLARDAVGGVLADAGASPGDVDSVFFANAAEGLLTGQECVRGQVVLQDTGLDGLPIVNCENACASASTAFHLAVSAIRGGGSEIALALGAEKLSNPDKGKSFGAFNAGWDVERYGGPDGGATHSGFMDVYARMSRDYMQSSGATAEDFAAISVKSHDNGALNPNAQYRDPLTVEQVLDSRMIAEPLRLLMCSPVGDGAAGALVVSEDGLRRLGGEPESAVRVAATALRSGVRDQAGELSAVVTAARAAYEQSGIGPEDADVVEVHDAAAPAELIVSEELGLAAPGAGPALLRAGATRIGGRIPINPSGGLLSRGHPVGATGCAQITELANQLRGRCGARQVEGARVALAENGGGWLGGGPAAAVVTILTRG